MNICITSCSTITRAIDPNVNIETFNFIQFWVGDSQTSRRLRIEISLHVTYHYILVATISNSIFILRHVI